MAKRPIFQRSRFTRAEWVTRAMTMAFALAEAALCVYIFSLPRHESVPTWIRPIAECRSGNLQDRRRQKESS
jgi:hypothetical protein